MFRILAIHRNGPMDVTDFILMGIKFRLIARSLDAWGYIPWSNWSPSHRLYVQCPWLTLFVK